MATELTQNKPDPMTKVLIADNSYISRNYLKTTLSAYDFEIAGEAISFKEVMNKFNETNPGIILLDISIAGENKIDDGVSLIEKMVEANPNAIIIVISNLQIKSIILDTLQKGAKYFILKPFTEEKILNALDRVLNDED